jgi:undecaprenyl-phosphate galactose phosphotransferase/putative colanic acid biosynthesis UDP-glucose lipid carrier transferase
MLKEVFSKYNKLFFLITDFFVLNSTYILSIWIYQNFIFNKFNLINNNTFKLLIYSNLIWIVLIRIFKGHNSLRFETIEKKITRLIKMIIIFVIIIILDSLLLRNISIPFKFILVFLLFFCVLSISFRLILIICLKNIRRKGINVKNIVIVGINQNAIDVIELFKKEVTFGYNLIGYIDTIESEFFKDKINYIGTLNEFLEKQSKIDIHEIYFTSEDYEKSTIKNLIEFCEHNFIRFKILPTFKQYTLNRKLNINFYNDVPVLVLRKEPLENIFNQTIKRSFDLFFSIIIILLIYPWLFPVVYLLIKLTSKGPVFFIQERSGQDNKIFNCYKFRTMRVNKESNSIGTLVNDPRITPVGKLLRKTRIDELPQFINVFLGQMSVVGPRPHMIKHTEEYSRIVNEFLVRQFVKPGITGWAQTTGYIDESRKLQEMKDKVIKDIWYIENWSFLLDIKIIVLTIFNIIRKDKNAY